MINVLHFKVAPTNINQLCDVCRDSNGNVLYHISKLQHLVHDKTCFMYFQESVTLINIMVNSLFKLGKALCADPMMFLALQHLNLQQENIFIVILFR